jgi:hypothetical protein
VSGDSGEISQVPKFHSRQLRYYQKYEQHQKQGISQFSLFMKSFGKVRSAWTKGKNVVPDENKCKYQRK